jgi:hypothetical protein
MKRRGGFILLVFLFGIPAFGEGATGFAPPVSPGRYGSGVSIELSVPGELEYRFVSADGHGHTDFFLPINGHLYLDAPAATSVPYHLEFRTVPDNTVHGPYTYIIDRLPPAPPVPDHPPGVYNTPLTLGFEKNADDDVTYRYTLRVDRDGSARSRGVSDVSGVDGVFRNIPESGVVELSGTPGEVVDITVIVHAVDGAGNRSEVREWPFRIDRINESSAPEEIIVSPVEGQFANEQLLLVNRQAFDTISVKLEGPDGTREFSYTEEFPVEGSGEFTVTVSAVLRGSRQEVAETVRWRQENRDLPVTSSGRYSDTISVFDALPSESFRYNFRDRPVTSRDSRVLTTMEVPAERDTSRTAVLRLNRESAAGTAEYRYVYILDGRRSPPPDAAEYKDTIILFSLSDTEIQYRTGRSSGASWILYREPLAAQQVISDGILEARARYPKAPWGPVRSIDLTTFRHESSGYTTSGETLPSVSLTGETVHVETSGGMTVLASPEGRVLLESRATGPLQWRLPRGYQAEVVAAAGAEEIRNVPPTPPDAEIAENSIQLTGSGEIYYRTEGERFRPLQQKSITLSGSDGVLVEHIVEAYTVFDGQISPTVRYRVPVDRRNLRLPPLQRRLMEREASGRFITNELNFSLSFDNPHDDFAIHYEIGESEFPRLPHIDSPNTRNSIVLEGADGETREFVVRVRGRFEGRSGWTAEKRYLVRLDRRPPEPPVLLEPRNGEVISEESGVVRFAEPADDGRIFFRLRPEERFRIYTEPVRIHGRQREDSDFLSIEAYTVDAAGNRSYLAEAVHARFGSDQPATPRIRLNGQPHGGNRILLERESLLEIETFGDDRAFWRLLDHGSSREQSGFLPYEEPVLLSSGNDSSRTFTLEMYTEAPSGRRSPLQQRVFHLDPSAALEAVPPDIIRKPSANEGTLYWAETADRRVFASITPGDTIFHETEGLLNWRIPDGADNIRVSYFIVDSDNRRSPTSHVSIPRSTVPEAPAISGVADGGLYRSRREIAISGAGDGAVRFAVSTGTRRPPPVHSLSAVYDGPINLEPAQGEDIRYHLAAAIEGNDGVISPERYLSFRIDRALPAPPELEAVETGAFFADTTDIHFSDPGENDIYYRLRRETDDPFTKYSGGPISLEAVPASLVQYRVEAYTVDPAGNRSQNVSSWDIFVDGEIVYVDPHSGNGDGSRGSPVSSIAQGIDILLREGRRTLFLAEGSYEVAPRTFSRVFQRSRRSERFSVIGGLNAENWRPGHSETRIGVENGATLELFGDVLFRGITVEPAVALQVVEGSVTLDRTILSGGSVEQLGGSAVLHRVTAQSVRVRGGDTTVRNSRIGSVEVLNGSDLTITDSTIGIGGPRDAGGHVAIRNAGSSLTVKESLIISTGEFFSHGVSSRGGQTVVENSVIMVLQGEEQIGIVSNDGGLSLLNSAVLVSGGSSEVSRAIQIRGAGRTPRVVNRVVLGEFPETSPVGLPSDTDAHTSSPVESTSALDRHSAVSAEQRSVPAAIRLDRESTVDLEDILLHGWPWPAAQQSSGVWGGERPIEGEVKRLQENAPVSVTELETIFRLLRSDAAASEPDFDAETLRRREMVTYLQDFLEGIFR